MPVGDPGVFVTAGEAESETGKGLIGRLDFGAFHRGIEIVVDGCAVHDAGNLITRIIVEEEVAVQRKRAIEQGVLGAEFIGIDELGLERDRMDRICEASVSE